MANPGSFMETPLVVWVQTFKSQPLAYKDLQDGIFLNMVMQQIDPRSKSDGMLTTVEETKDRVSNWDILMKNIKSYYQEVLQQFIVMKLPNIVTISREPESDNAKNELQKVLLLILGCAVQCEKKEQFIENIKQLDINTQHGIVEYIKEITDDTKNVFAIDMPPDQMDEVSRSMHYHLRMLIQERDGYVEELKDMNQNLDELHIRNQELQRVQTQRGGELQTTTAPLLHHSPDKQEKQHLTVELSEVKAKMRKLRQELEEKTEYTLELEEELDETKAEAQKLRNENLDLTQDARAARTYRDELDILKEKASRVDKFESEITKYKERLNELEFFKSRVDELREDNQLLVDTRNELEEQLESSHKRIETVVELENELLKYKKHIQELSEARDIDRQKIAELSEELMRLEFDKKSSFNETANLEDELQRTSKRLKSGISSTLSDQLNETANAKLLRLELENQRLLKRLDDVKDNQLLDHSSKFLELEKENHRLSKKVEQLQEVKSRESNDHIQLEHVTHELKHEKQQLEETIATVKESSERQVKELERENIQLQETVQTLRERNEKTNDVRLKELEKDNKRLSESMKTVTAQLSNVEYDKRQLHKNYERLEENVQRISEFEEENQCLEKENEDLRKNVTTLERTCEKYDKLEQESSDFEVENQKLNKMVETLQKSVTNMETLEQDNINLTVELQHVKRSVETLKGSSSKLAELEHTKDIQNREIQQLKKTIENSKMDKERQEQLETDLLELDNENQKLQRQTEGMSRKLQDVEKDNTDLESQITKYQKSVENMKISMKKLSELERENRDLETENNKLHREHTTLEKENKRLKQSIETKDTSIDDITSKLSIKEHEVKNMKKRVEQTQDRQAIVKEIERENTELIQQSSMDKKTLATLREDLVNEKIRSQQQSNELEKLARELEKVGLNKSKLLATEQAHDESKYAALECMMEEAYKNTLSIKEEKIHELQSRLDDSKSRNLRIQEEIQSVKRDNAALQQRQEEEIMLYKQQSPRDKDSNGSGSTHSTKLIMHPNATKEILELKDHIITLERSNATLEAENRNLLSQREEIQSQVTKSQSQQSHSQSQLTSVQDRFNDLQTQCANLQVENRTLQSQSASLMSQNASLQRQHSDLEGYNDQVVTAHEDLQHAHESLQSDHDALEKLHEQLATEYEALISEHGSLKGNHKTLRADLKELQDKNMILFREKETVAEVRELLERDKQEMKLESRSHSALQLDYVRLKEEIMRLQNSKERSEREYRDLSAEHKSLKTEYNTLKSKYSDLKSTFDECSKQLSGMDVEVTKLANKCDHLVQLNNRLEEENRNLMMQLQALLNQNQEILTQSLDSKDQLHEEQKLHLEKLNDLRRQKEKLEEKIMEQYKRYDPAKKKKSGFFKKAKALVGKSEKRDKRSKSLGPAEFSQYVYNESPGESSSIGSGSHDLDGSASKNSKNKKNRRGSEGSFLEDSPNLSTHSKALAKSTTALNYSKNEPSYDGSFQNMRGARSDDNLLDSPPQTLRSDGSPASNNSEWPMRQGQRRLLDGSTSTNRSRASMASTADDDEPELTLEEFLQECNKSPKSRRKWLVENRVELDLEKDKKGNKKPVPEPLSQVLSPTLGPRSPTVEDPPSKSLLASQRSKSEMNISKMTTLSAVSNIDLNTSATLNRPNNRHAESFTSPRASQPPFNTNTWTSTPKYSRDVYNRPQGERSQPQPQQPARSHSIGGGHPGGPPVNYRGMNGDYMDHQGSGPAPLRSQSVVMDGEVSQPDGRIPRQNSGSSVGSGSIGAYNTTTRQTTGTSSSAFSPPQPQSNGGSPHLGGGSHTLPRQASQHRRETSNDSSERPFLQAGSGAYNTPIQRSRTPSAKDLSRHLGPSPMKASYIPPDIHNESIRSTSGGDQYNPGNVRNLVQNLQKNMQQQQHGGSNPNQQQGSPTSSSGSYNPSSAGSNSNQVNSNQAPPPSTYNRPHSQSSVPYSSSPGTLYNNNNQNQPQNQPLNSSFHHQSQQQQPNSSFQSPKSTSYTHPTNSATPSYKSPPVSLGYHHNNPTNSSREYSTPQSQHHHQQQPQHNTSQYNKYQTGPISSMQQPSDPVAPPRRSRPMSAGPLATSNSSAFSAPQPSSLHNRSYTPTHTMGGGIMDRNERGKSLPPQMMTPVRGGSNTGRTLPVRPDERPQPQGQSAVRVAPPGRTPPRPQGDENGPLGAHGPSGDGGQPPNGEKLKNSKWYEYGCV